MTVYVAVCGPAQPSDEEAKRAHACGRLLAEAGAIVVTGGLGGVMEAASRGACEAGGLVVGLLPQDGREHANPYCTVTVPTGLGEARNALVVRAADAVIAVGGGYGTLSEVALALKSGKPVIGLRTWDLGDAIVRADTPEDAVAAALRRLTDGRGRSRSSSGGPGRRTDTGPPA